MRYLVFLGSVRDTAPPRPKRLGARVAQAVLAELDRSGHDVSLVDPLGLSSEAKFKPHFAYAPGRAPPELEALARDIEEADGYVMISPEYNHSMSPALAHLLNHFGSSLFSYKPSVIVTYSAGQWGGARAGVAMRAFLSELGCLPVSAMVHVPKAQEVFDAEGHYQEDAEGWKTYFGRALGQLDWWAEAAAYGRRTLPSPDPFTRDPAERNAPT